MKWYNEIEALEHYDLKTIQELWVLTTLGLYAYQQIKVQYKIDKASIHLSSICSDKRRTNTVKNVLIDAGILDSPCYIDTNLQINHKKYEELAPSFARAPTFMADGWCKKKNSYYSSSDEDKEPMNECSNAYTNIDNLDAKELIYVQTHLDEYDISIQEKNESYSNKRGYGATHSIRMLLYPTASLPALIDAVYHAKLCDYTMTHLPLVLHAVYGDKFEVLGKNKISLDNVETFPNHTSLTQKDIRVHIVTACAQLHHYQQALKELLTLRRYAQQTRSENYLTALVKKFQEHLAQNASLYINDEDEDTKQLALLLMKGNKIALVNTWKNNLKDPWKKLNYKQILLRS